MQPHFPSATIFPHRPAFGYRQRHVITFSSSQTVLVVSTVPARYYQFCPDDIDDAHFGLSFGYFLQLTESATAVCETGYIQTPPEVSTMLLSISPHPCLPHW